jgi:putative spermidine/putrescine transport system permease protein
VVVSAVGIYSVFLRWNLVGNVLGFVLAHSVLAIPLVVITVSASLRVFDTRLEQAAASLGASPLKTFRTVTLPGIRAGVLAGAFLAFLTSFDETAISLFLATPEVRTLPVEIYGGITRFIDPTVAAASTLVFLITAAGVMTAALLPRRTLNDAI